MELPLGPAIFDLLTGVFSRFVGQPVQRWRANRLARRGKVNCILFEPSNATVLPTRVVAGAAEVWSGRIRCWDADLWVRSVDLPGEEGPASRRSDGDFWFSPPSRILTLHTHRGTVKWAVLAWQAEWAISLLDLAPTDD